MIQEAEGNLLDANVDVLVNTVNTVGVMGKGIALQFKQAYPENFKAYQAACRRREVRLGHMFVFATSRLSPKWIVNFPTKKHWRSKSRLKDVKNGLADLRRTLVELGAESVAVPPLGCGNGGLDWTDVRPLILEALSDLDGLRVLMYPPRGTPAPRDMPVRTTRPSMTLGRAALVAVMNRYDTSGFGVSPIELQKLMYFLQEAGEPLRLRYDKARYGPYADNLNHVLQRVEGHFVRGYGDRSRLVADAAPLMVTPEGVAAAYDLLEDHADTQERIERVAALAEGFDSPYGMELLATVHWLVRGQYDQGSPTLDSLVSSVHAWSGRKKGMFKPRHIQIALRKLISQGWVSPEHRAVATV